MTKIFFDAQRARMECLLSKLLDYVHDEIIRTVAEHNGDFRRDGGRYVSGISFLSQLLASDMAIKYVMEEVVEMHVKNITEQGKRMWTTEQVVEQFKNLIK